MRLDPDYTPAFNEETGVLSIDLPGTDSWTDMIANLRIGRRRVHGCRVNKLDRAEALYIIRELRPLIEKAKEIHLYGHSRGGAVALQVFWELTHSKGQHKAPKVVVTAAKTTGDRWMIKALRPWMRLSYIRAYRQRGDIIPFLPPWQKNIKHSLFGKWQPFWRAHAVKNYREVKKQLSV